MTRAVFLLIIVFLLFSYAVCTIEAVTLWDTAVIVRVQDILGSISPSVPIAAGGFVFYAMTLLSVFSGGLYFFIRRMYRNMLLFLSILPVSYTAGHFIKQAAQRPRPPIELQLEEHMTSFSYISRHTLITACLWGVLLYIIFKYCKNNTLKYLAAAVSILWIIFEGFSRVWSGVHYPSDVIGALIASAFFIIIYIKLLDLK